MDGFPNKEDISGGTERCVRARNIWLPGEKRGWRERRELLDLVFTWQGRSKRPRKGFCDGIEETNWCYNCYGFEQTKDELVIKTVSSPRSPLDDIELQYCWLGGEES